MEYFDKIGQWIKHHPYATGGVLFALALLWYLFVSSSSTQGTAVISNQPSNAEIQAGAQIQNAQLQSQTTLGVAQLQLQGQGQQIAGQTAIATLQAQTAQNYNELNAQTTQQGNTLQAQTTQAISTLQAQVAEAQIGAGVVNNQTQAAALVAVATAPYQAQEQIAQLQYNYALASLPTNAQISNLQNQINSLSSGIQQFGANVNQQFANTNTAVGDINAWTQKYWGGTVAPINIQTGQTLSNVA